MSDLSVSNEEIKLDEISNSDNLPLVVEPVVEQIFETVVEPVETVVEPVETVVEPVETVVEPVVEPVEPVIEQIPEPVEPVIEQIPEQVVEQIPEQVIEQIPETVVQNVIEAEASFIEVQKDLLFKFENKSLQEIVFYIKSNIDEEKVVNYYKKLNIEINKELIEIIYKLAIKEEDLLNEIEKSLIDIIINLNFTPLHI